MNSAIEAQLTQDAIKLDRLNRDVVKAVVEWNPDNISKSLKKYGSLGKSVGTISLEKHLDILQNAVKENQPNSKKERPSAHRDITKSGVLDQVICVRESKH